MKIFLLCLLLPNFAQSRDSTPLPHALCPKGQKLDESGKTCICKKPWHEVFNSYCRPICRLDQKRVGDQCLPICGKHEKFVSGKCAPNCPVGKRFLFGKCYTPEQEELLPFCRVVCPDGYDYVDGICLPQCPKDKDRVGKDCVPKCPPGDEHYEGKCIPACKEDEERLHGVCIPKCPEHQERRFDDKCYPICGPYQERVKGICKPKCDHGEERYHGECVPKCCKHEIRFHGECISKCNQKQELLNGFCVPKCLWHQKRVGLRCVSRCPIGFYLKEGRRECLKISRHMPRIRIRRHYRFIVPDANGTLPLPCDIKDIVTEKKIPFWLAPQMIREKVQNVTQHQKKHDRFIEIQLDEGIDNFLNKNDNSKSV